MTNVTEKEGVVNNSNQPSQDNNLQRLINQKINELSQKSDRLSKEINGLKSIQVKEENNKIVVGSTELLIEDFMTEPSVHEYQKWLKKKEDFENWTEDKIEEVISEEKDDMWYNEWTDEVYNHFDSCDIDVWDYMSERDFIHDYLDRDSYDIEWVKDNYFENLDDNQILKDRLLVELKQTIV